MASHILVGSKTCSDQSYQIYILYQEYFHPIGTAIANSVESVLRCPSRVYIDNVKLMSHNVTRTSHKPFQYNNKFDCSDLFSIKYRYIAIVYWKNINFIYSFDRIMNLN